MGSKVEGWDGTVNGQRMRAWYIGTLHKIYMTWHKQLYYASRNKKFQFLPRFCELHKTAPPPRARMRPGVHQNRFKEIFTLFNCSMLMMISFLRASMDFLKNIWRAKDEMQVCERKILLNKVLNVHNAFSLKRFGAPFSHLCAREDGEHNITRSIILATTN